MAAPPTLFGNQREANLASTVAMIEDVLIELGHVVDKARVALADCECAWRVSQGSAVVEIAITPADEGGWLRLSASVMTVDPARDPAPLWRHLLTLNGERTSTAAFGLCGPAGEMVMLIAQRSTRDLDRSEVVSLIQSVCQDAVQFESELCRDFGARAGG